MSRAIPDLICRSARVTIMNSDREPILERPVDVELVPVSAPADVELVPFAMPVSTDDVDVSLAVDPLPHLERIRRSRQRWRLTALASLAGCIVAAALIAIQYGNTWTTCRLLNESRRLAEEARKETAVARDENRILYEQVLADRQNAATVLLQLKAALGEVAECRDQCKTIIAKDSQLEFRRQELIADMTIEARKALTQLRNRTDLDEILGEISKQSDDAVLRVRNEGYEMASALDILLHEMLHLQRDNPFVRSNAASNQE
jgi:hypothetical protein